MMHKYLMTSLLYLFILNLGLAQEVLFEENFNTCTLPAGWKVEIDGYQDVAWEIGIPSNPKANGLSIDGSCMLVIDDDLTGDNTDSFAIRFYTPYFHGNDYADLNAAMDVHFRRDKAEYLRIIVESKGQEHILREFKNRNFTGDAFDQFGKVNLDLGLYAKDSMRIIIEFDDTNIWGWWAGVDNITVSGSKKGEIILKEKFNDCSLENGWSSEIVSGVDPWRVGIFDDGRSIDGSCFVFFNDDILGEEAPLSKVRLYSPKFDGASYADYQLSYDFIFRTYEESEYLQLYIDNGKEWLPVKTYKLDVGGPNVDVFVKEIVDLSEFRSDSIRLIWEYYDGGWGWWLGLDNVTIVGSGTSHDKCNNAVVLQTDQTCLDFNNRGALSDPEFFTNSIGGSRFLYYTFTPQEVGMYEIETQSQFNDQLEIFKGDCSTNQLMTTAIRDEYGFVGEKLSVELLPAENYIIRVSGKQAEFGIDKGNGCIQVKKINTLPQPPVNDVCSSSIIITANEDCTQSHNILGNITLVPDINKRSRADVWYQFEASEPGTYTFESQANFADVLAVYSGNCNSLDLVHSNYEGGEIDILAETEGEVFYIQVSGYFSTIEGQLCPKITNKPVTPPVNENCMGAFALSYNTDCSASSNMGAGFSGIQPTCDVYADADIWYSFTGSMTGEIYLRNLATFEHIVSIYTGNCDTLISIYCNKNHNGCDGYLHVNGLLPGVQYFIQISSKSTQIGFQKGDVCLHLLDTEPIFTKISMTVDQECIGLNAVRLLPTVTGGKGNVELFGEGIQNLALSGDTYYIAARDEEGCEVSAKVETQECNELQCALGVLEELMNESCYGANDGAVQLNVVNGVEPIEYNWEGGYEGNTLANVDAGTYKVTIADGTGVCNLVKEFIVSSPLQIEAAIEKNDITCYGLTDGNVMIQSNEEIDYLWENGETISSLTGLSAGSYSVSLTNQDGCTRTEMITINEPMALLVSDSISQLVCAEDNNGEISLHANGGVGNYVYNWSTGSTESYITNLSSGLYAVTVVDDNGCQLESSYSLDMPEPLQYNVTLLSLGIYDTPATIYIEIEGGEGPYQVDWFLDGELQHSENMLVFESFYAGLIEGVITDSKGCKKLLGPWLSYNLVSTEDKLTQAIHLLPNPVLNLLTINGSVGSLSVGNIYDAQGKLVKMGSRTSMALPCQIDVSHLLPGIYIVGLEINGIEIYKTFIKM